MNASTFTMLNSLLIGLCILTFIIMGITIIKMLKRLDQKDEVLHNKYSIKEDSVYSTVVQKIICKLKYDLQVTKVVIGRFHNGGNYVNGLPMKKFTLTHETAGGCDIPMMDKCVNVINSRYSEAFAQLATLGDYCISDVTDCPDANYKIDMSIYGFKASYLFLIRQFDGREDGFIGLNFKHTTVLTAEQRHKVKEQLPRIMGLLNMEKDNLKD